MTPFPLEPFNPTGDRKSAEPSFGVTNLGPGLTLTKDETQDLVAFLRQL